MELNQLLVRSLAGMVAQQKLKRDDRQPGSCGGRETHYYDADLLPYVIYVHRESNALSSQNPSSPYGMVVGGVAHYK